MIDFGLIFEPPQQLGGINMKFTILMSVIVAGLLNAHVAFASGCFPRTRFELGPQILPNQSVFGLFTCSQYYCNFEDQASHLKFSNMTDENYMPPSQFPPTGRLMSFSVEGFEAMIWNDCDGSDPVPPYVRNGTYVRFLYSGHEFSSFIPL